MAKLNVPASVFCVSFLLITLYEYRLVRECLTVCRRQHDIAISLARCFCVLTFPITLYHTYEHCTHFVCPRMQADVLRIIWLIPAYSLESLLSIIYPNYQFIIQSLREFYEAYVLYCFTRLLINYMNNEGQFSNALKASVSNTLITHTFPFCYLEPWELSKDFLKLCKTGVYQHIVVRLLLVCIAIPLQQLELYDASKFSFVHLHTWMSLINVVSQYYALYCMYLLYHVTKKELSAVRSLEKFISIKVLIFMSWYQALLVAYLVHIEVITPGSHGSNYTSAQALVAQIEQLIKCIEMLLAAAFFVVSFPVSDFYYYGDNGDSPKMTAIDINIDANSIAHTGEKDMVSMTNRLHDSFSVHPPKHGVSTFTQPHAPVNDIGNDSYSSHSKSSQTSVLLFGVIPLVGAGKQTSISCSMVCYSLYLWLVGVPTYIKKELESSNELDRTDGLDTNANRAVRRPVASYLGDDEERQEYHGDDSELFDRQLSTGMGCSRETSNTHLWDGKCYGNNDRGLGTTSSGDVWESPVTKGSFFNTTDSHSDGTTEENDEPATLLGFFRNMGHSIYHALPGMNIHSNTCLRDNQDCGTGVNGQLKKKSSNTNLDLLVDTDIEASSSALQYFSKSTPSPRYLFHSPGDVKGGGDGYGTTSISINSVPSPVSSISSSAYGYNVLHRSSTVNSNSSDFDGMGPGLGRNKLDVHKKRNTYGYGRGAGVGGFRG